MDFKERLILRTGDSSFDVTPRLGGQAVHSVIYAAPIGVWHTRLQREGPVDEFRFVDGITEEGVSQFVAAVETADSELPVNYRDLRR